MAKGIKPYPLREKILKTILEFETVKIKTMHKAVEEVYGLETVKRKLRQMEKDGLLYSTRDEKSRKWYSLTEEGKKQAKKIKENYGGLSKSECGDICLNWAIDMQGSTKKQQIFEYVQAVNMQENGKVCVLTIKDKGLSTNEFLNKIFEGKRKTGIDKIYIYVDNNIEKNRIVEELKERGISEGVEFYERE